jgi:hypothetical protein
MTSAAKRIDHLDRSSSVFAGREGERFAWRAPQTGGSTTVLMVRQFLPGVVSKKACVMQKVRPS